jgi:hypothetical protein
MDMEKDGKSDGCRLLYFPGNRVTII